MSHRCARSWATRARSSVRSAESVMPPTPDTRDSEWPTPREAGADPADQHAANQHAADRNAADENAAGEPGTWPLDVAWRTAGGTPIPPAKTLERIARDLYEPTGARATVPTG